MKTVARGVMLAILGMPLVGCTTTVASGRLPDPLVAQIMQSNVLSGEDESRDLVRSSDTASLSTQIMEGVRIVQESWESGKKKSSSMIVGLYHISEAASRNPSLLNTELVQNALELIFSWMDGLIDITQQTALQYLSEGLHKINLLFPLRSRIYLRTRLSDLAVYLNYVDLLARPSREIKAGSATDPLDAMHKVLTFSYSAVCSMTLEQISRLGAPLSTAFTRLHRIVQTADSLGLIRAKRLQATTAFSWLVECDQFGQLVAMPSLEENEIEVPQLKSLLDWGEDYSVRAFGDITELIKETNSLDDYSREFLVVHTSRASALLAENGGLERFARALCHLRMALFAVVQPQTTDHTDLGFLSRGLRTEYYRNGSILFRRIDALTEEGSRLKFLVASLFPTLLSKMTTTATRTELVTEGDEELRVLWLAAVLDVSRSLKTGGLLHLREVKTALSAMEPLFVPAM